MLLIDRCSRVAAVSCSHAKQRASLLAAMSMDTSGAHPLVAYVAEIRRSHVVVNKGKEEKLMSVSAKTASVTLTASAVSKLPL